MPVQADQSDFCKFIKELIWTLSLSLQLRFSELFGPMSCTYFENPTILFDSNVVEHCCCRRFKNLMLEAFSTSMASCPISFSPQEIELHFSSKSKSKLDRRKYSHRIDDYEIQFHSHNELIQNGRICNTTPANQSVSCSLPFPRGSSST